jgi:GNAT superfamily N-acetyltransferase
VRRELPGGYELDDDRRRIDVDAVHAYIGGESYWAKGRTREKMEAALEGSARVIGLYAPDGSQAGFARVISDSTTYAYLADVYVLEEHRGRGFGLELIRETLEGDPWSHISWHLRTRDAHALYEKFGFKPTTERSLER